jgi:hypothetical protein
MLMLIVESSIVTAKLFHDNDFSSLLQGKGDDLFMVSHVESRPAAMYLTELEQDENSGELPLFCHRNSVTFEFE